MVVVVVSMLMIVSMLVSIVSILVAVVPIVPSVHMARLDISLVVVVWCINDLLRVHRGCVVGRGSLHRRGGSTTCCSKAGEEESKDLHGWREYIGMQGRAG